MPGSKIGGQRAAATNKKKYGEDFYRKIASIGGRATGPKGFALMDPEKVKAAGRKGGSRSKRTGVTTGQGKKREYYYSGDGVFNKDKKKIDEHEARQKELPKPPKKSFIKRILGGDDV